MKKILVFLFAFLLLVACIRVTGLFRRLLQRHSPYYENISRLKNGAKSSPSITFLLKTYENYVAV